MTSSSSSSSSSITMPRRLVFVLALVLISALFASASMGGTEQNEKMAKEIVVMKSENREDMRRDLHLLMRHPSSGGGGEGAGEGEGEGEGDGSSSVSSSSSAVISGCEGCSPEENKSLESMESRNSFAWWMALGVAAGLTAASVAAMARKVSWHFDVKAAAVNCLIFVHHSYNIC